MTRYAPPALMAALCLFAFAAQAAQPELTVTVEGIAPGKAIPGEQAVCLPTPDGKSNAAGKNLRPTLSWSGAPEGTHSFAIFIMDPDVPADFADAGKEGKVIAKDAKRQDFFHYGVVNIPARMTDFPGSAVETKLGYTPLELTNDMGLNKYVPTPTAYGGPCPPWNDARVHSYHYIVLALDKDADAILNAPPATDCNNPSCMTDSAKDTFTRLLSSKHVLAKGVVIGTYTLNPSQMK